MKKYGDMEKNIFLKEIAFYTLGVALIGGYVYLYWTRFVNKLVAPPLIMKLYNINHSLVFIINAMVFILFLIFIPYKTKIEWKSKGVFSAFILALFAEMFGIPLLIYIFSPFVGNKNFYINIDHLHSINLVGHYFIFGWTGMVIGSYLTLIGMVLVYIGWAKIHKSKELVTEGIYKYIRHPQYTGLFFIITGWIIHWANVLTFLMYPIMIYMYYRLAKKEEKELIQYFGSEYEIYLDKTSMFFPINLRSLRKIN